MKPIHYFCYSLLAVVALTPLGVRAVTWLRQRPEPVDPQMARAGQVLFEHDWTVKDELCSGGDGLGPVYNDTSCVSCHQQGGIGGSGGKESNITAFMVVPRPPGCNTPPTLAAGPSREGVLHKFAVRPELQEVPERVGATAAEQVHLSERRTPALFGAGLIDAILDRDIIANERSQRVKYGLAPAKGEEIPVGRAMRLPNGRIGHFGWKAQTATLGEFVQNACANELGLSNPGHPQPQPLGQPALVTDRLDLTLEQCQQLTSFIASLPAPSEGVPAEATLAPEARSGKGLFNSIGCVDCHTPDVGPAKGIYSDLLLHQMGRQLVGGGSYGEPPPALPNFAPGTAPGPSEWRTPPLWGVADSGPYLHDGRAKTLKDAIEQHGGQAARASQRFKQLPGNEQTQLVAFLQSLRAPKAPASVK